MSTLTFTFFEALQAAGVPIEKAKATVESLDNVIEKQSTNLSRDLATKADLEKVRTEIEKIRTEIAPLKWITGVMAAGIISIVMKTFF